MVKQARAGKNRKGMPAHKARALMSQGIVTHEQGPLIRDLDEKQVIEDMRALGKTGQDGKF